MLFVVDLEPNLRWYWLRIWCLLLNCANLRLISIIQTIERALTLSHSQPIGFPKRIKLVFGYKAKMLLIMFLRICYITKKKIFSRNNYHVLIVESVEVIL